MATLEVLKKIRSPMETHSITLADIEAFVDKRRGRKAEITAAAKLTPVPS